MTETPEQFIERVWAYTEKATKGPWYLVEAPWRASYYDKEIGEHVLCTTYVVAGNPDPHGGKAVLDGVEIEEWESHKQRDEFVNQSDMDLSFAANARTDLPAALSIIETLVRERDEARERVKHLQWVAGEARGWIARHDQFGGNIYEALISQLDRACEVDDAAVAAMKGVPSE